VTDTDDDGGDHQDGTKDQWKESRPGQVGIAQIELPGLPDEKGSDDRQHGGDENAAATIAERAMKARPMKPPRLRSRWNETRSKA
jgi:hypothetical protein